MDISSPHPFSYPDMRVKVVTYWNPFRSLERDRLKDIDFKPLLF